MRLYSIFFSALLCLFALAANAQEGWLAPVLDDPFINPGLHHENRVQLQLVGIETKTWFSEIAPSDFVRENNGTTFFDLEQGLDELGAENQIRQWITIPTLGASVRFGNWTGQVRHQMRIDGYLNAPEELARLLYQGNAQYIGQEIALDNEFYGRAWQEVGLGLSRKLGNLSVGARVNFLFGNFDASTAQNQNNLSLYTDEEIYALQFQTDYRVNNSGGFNYNGFDDISFENQDDFITGRGIGLDLALNYQTELLQIALVGRNIAGTIDWDTSPVNYTSNGTIDYNGQDFNTLIDNDNVSFENLVDSLENVLEFDETNEAYSTRLPTDLRLMGRFRLTEKLAIGGSTWLDANQNRTIVGAAAFAERQFGKRNGSAIYGALGMTQNAPLNLGLGFRFKVGPILWRLGSDNVLAAISGSNYTNAYFNWQFAF